jgi:tripartite-type tricarboxylate transporter receptor subunit TctC
MLHVPYKSAGQATAALVSGEAQVLLTNMASVLPHVKSGRIRALGISSPKRSALAPELPTLSEAGVPGFEYATWYGMLVPAGTPKAVIGQLHADVTRVINSQTVREQFTGQGLGVYGTAPAQFDAYLGAEIAKWDKLVRVAGVKVD